MKKVCLMTSEESFLTNYGAALQGFALYNIVKNAGYDVNIQRYLGGILDMGEKKQVSYHRILNYSLIEIYLKCLFRVGKLIHRKGIIIQQNLFQKFQDELMSFYSGERKTWKTLKNNPPKADIYLCGSDQIWNPSFKNGYNDPGYFLAFTKKNKISYAPSFGVSDIPESAQDSLNDLLSDFDYISVREKAGAEIIKKYTKKDAIVVLDPTLLIDENKWKEIATIPNEIPEKYILCYRFGNSLKVNRDIKRIAKLLKLPIIELPLSGISYLNHNEKRLFNVGPKEFIGLINNATLVCTDSFHATVFSILMETPFVTFLRSDDQKKSEGMNSRVMNLLDILLLQERLSANIDLTNRQDLLHMNFKKAKKILYQEKEKSLDWLLTALRRVDEIDERTN